MKNRVITYTILGVIIALFTLYYAVENIIYTKPGASMMGFLDQIDKEVYEQNWSAAEDTIQKIEKLWSVRKYWLTLNFGEESYSDFLENVDKLKRAIKYKDPKQASEYISASKGYWNNFRKIVPEP